MISLNDFEKQYDQLLFSNANTIFPSNEINFLMGKNGCGKTTLFKCLSGLENYKGTILYDDKNLNEIRDELFVLWDDTPFYLKLSGYDNLILFSEKKEKRSQIIKMAQDYLPDKTLKRKVKTYSYGQKKKLSLILLDILKPKYILMDEISNGLDIDTMEMLQNKIDNIKNESTIILTGHQFNFYQKIADNVFVKNNDKIIKEKKNKNDPSSLEKIYHEKIN